MRNKWLELDYAATGRGDAPSTWPRNPRCSASTAPTLADLRKLRDLNRKVIVHSGLVDDAIPPAGNIHYHERVVAAMGGHAEVQKFMRMYLVPGAPRTARRAVPTR